MTVASLPMYDLPVLRGPTDAWWEGLTRALRREGVAEVPDRLHRGRRVGEAWGMADLLLSQCCGFDLTHDAARFLRPVVTPCYAAEGCDGPFYRSFIVVRDDAKARDLEDLRGLSCAVNDRRSHSGWNALRHALAPHAGEARFFSQVLETAGHSNSLSFVREGRADVAAIDCVTHALLQRHKAGALAGLRVLARTASAPGLPYVTRVRASDQLVARLRAAIFRALEDPSLEPVRADLLIAGAETLPGAAYDRIIEMETLGQSLG